LLDAEALRSKPSRFVFDDLAVIVHNPQLQSGSLIEAMSFNPFRSAVYFTYWAQMQWQYGGTVRDTEAMGFMFANVFFHWLAGITLFWTARLIWPGRKYLPALAAAFFWLNPVFMEAGNFVLGRTEIMAAIFYLLAICFYLDRTRPAISRAGFFAAFILALFSKEVAATLPLTIFLLSLFRSERPRRPEIIGGFALAAVYLALRLNWAVELAKNPGLVPPWPAYFINQNWIFWFASLKTLIPLHLNFDYNLKNHILPGIIFLALNLGILAALVFASMRGFKTGWLLLVYPVLYLPLLVIPLADPFRESRLYLPGIWLALLFALAVSSAWEKRKTLAWAFVIAAMCFLCALSFKRGQVWTSEERLWRDALENSPDKFRPAYNYASALRRQLELDHAKKVYLWAKDLAPDNPKVDWALGLIDEAQKHPEEIEKLKAYLKANRGTLPPGF